MSGIIRCCGRPIYVIALATVILPIVSLGQSLDSVRAAASLYNEALGRLGSAAETPSDRQKAVQLMPILPSEVRSSVFEAVSPPIPAEDASERLKAWWRYQDPLPGSEVNERMIEHLRRVNVALEQYVDGTDERGYDDRGEVYVRFGKPERVTEIRFDAPSLIDDLYQPGVSVSPSDFPHNEFWRYRHVGNMAYFLFVEKDGRYSIGEIQDLVPEILRVGLMNSGVRGQRRTSMLLSTLHAVFEQLAVEHSDFASTFQAIDNYHSSQSQTGRLANRDITGSYRDRLNPDATESNPDELLTGYLAPHEFIDHILVETSELDYQTAWRRFMDLPSDFSAVPGAIAELRLAVRSARFLDEDGSTRIELYWTTLPGELMAAPQDDPMLTLSVRQYALNYETSRAINKAIRLAELPRVADVTLPTQTVTLGDLTDMFHIGMQYELGSRSRPSDPPVRVAVVRRDSLQVLRGRGDQLEMSDLKPILLSATAGESPLPYPHEELWDGLPIGLYFEIYHLVFDADDETRYSVNYEISDPIGRRSPTSVKYTSTGYGRTAREDILLDLSSWNDTGPIQVTVTITDENAGQHVERSLLFNMTR